MKKGLLIYGTILIFLLVGNIGCDDNSKSLGSFGIDIATLIPDEGNSYSLILDNGKKLWPASKAVNYTPQANQRVFLNYTILSEERGGYDHHIRVNDIWSILTKQVIELNSENSASMGNDPLKANAVWVGGDYLNISFMFNYGGVRPHAINLAKSSPESPSTATDIIELEFRHNSYNSRQYRLFEGFVCFDLKPLRSLDSDSVKLSIKVKEWADKSHQNSIETIFDVVYRYNQPYLQSRTEMPIPVISSNEYY